MTTPIPAGPRPSNLVPHYIYEVDSTHDKIYIEMRAKIIKLNEKLLRLGAKYKYFPGKEYRAP